jgi:membrane-associated phospholipid phosphatase
MIPVATRFDSRAPERSDVPGFLSSPERGETVKVIGASGAFNWLMFAILGTTALIEIYLAHLENYADVWIAIDAFPWLFPLAIVAWYCDWAAHDRLRDLLLCVFWGFALTFLTGPLVEIAARSPFPLVDHALARTDSLLIQTAPIIQWLAHIPGASRVSDSVYDFLTPPLVLAPLAVPTLFGQPDASRRYVVSSTIALLLTLALFALFPAAGPWSEEGFPPAAQQAATEARLRAIKLHHPAPVTAQGEGLVSFPSFHTILAVLSALALWSVRRVRWFGLVISVLVCISTVTTGWHYLIDVAGGLVVALATWWLSTHCCPARTGI